MTSFTILQVCRRLRDIIKQSPSLQYKIELFHDYLIANPGIQAPSSSLLQRLLQSRRAWDRLTPTTMETIQVDGVSVYEIREGVWLSGKTQSPFSDAIRTILMLELPASTPLTNRMEKAVMELDFDASDVTVLPSQDLLVILQDQAGCVFLRIYFICPNHSN
jgi:hypothetical protein